MATASPTPTAAQILAELKALGSEQTAKTFRRHGAEGEVFGVKFGDMGKLVKKLKTNHPLALALWETGNSDARTLAAMIADPAQMTDATLEAWLGSTTSHGLIDLVAGPIAGRMPSAQRHVKVWTASPDEWRGRAGFQLLANLATHDATLSDDFFRPYLETIEREIHTRPNRTREAMNTALIAIGVRNPALEKLALAVAAKIGPVDVDHGDTSCKTPDAAAYIHKTLAHRNRKQVTHV